MRIAITGSTGLIGTALTEHLRQAGHSVTRVVRRGSPARNQIGIHWDIPSQQIDLKGLEGHDAVIHLAGANIAGQRWTPAYKEDIRLSRVNGTRLLSDAILKLQEPPKVFICASAIGYYGDVDPVVCVDEDSLPGTGFLAEVCQQWEEAAKPASKAGIRVVHMRTGVVLSPKGGALAKMLPIFKLGLGGIVGSGRQAMSWISLQEIPYIVENLLRNDKLAGAVNVVSPQSVTNAEFTKTLGRVLQRPVVFPVPSWTIKILLGEMGETLLLGGASVLPKRLVESGYRFLQPDLESVLRRCLAR